MSETLIAIAHTALSHHDWSALIQCLRQFSSESSHFEQGAHGTSHHRTSEAASQGGHPDVVPWNNAAAEVEAIVSFAVRALSLADFQTRWELVSAISKFGTVAIPPLVDLLNDFDVGDDDEGDWDLLWFIARILGQIHHPSAIVALVQVLQVSPTEDVVSATVMALSQQGREAVPPITLLLEHDATKLVAIQALARIFVKDPDQALRECLTTISQDEDATVRAVVIEALSHSHHPDIAAILIQALDDVAASVRRAAVVGLGLQAKTISDEILLSALEPQLWDLDAEVRRQTAIALGRMQSTGAAELLSTALKSQDFPTPLKPDVVRALIWTDTQAGLESLNDYLQNQLPKAEIYQEIAVMLGRVTVSELKGPATHLLLDLLQNHGVTHQSVIIRQSIAMSLGQLRQPMAASVLQELTQDDDERVRLHAIAALKTLNNEWPERSSQHE
ncbi:MAG: HEAT repeat domain-containing protein [Merismopedia sp. SIO2A8]|nr:HEAT repeat domain-containing protein [Merismopedia sp. SIO2A8]